MAVGDTPPTPPPPRPRYLPTVPIYLGTYPNSGRGTWQRSASLHCFDLFVIEKDVIPVIFIILDSVMNFS